MYGEENSNKQMCRATEMEASETPKHSTGSPMYTGSLVPDTGLPVQGPAGSPVAPIIFLKWFLA